MTTEVRLRCKADGGLMAVLSGTTNPEVIRWCIDPRAAQHRPEFAKRTADLDEWLGDHPGYVISEGNWPPTGWLEAPLDHARDPEAISWVLCPTRGCKHVEELPAVIKLLEVAWRQGRSTTKL